MISTWLADLISQYSWVNRVEKRGLYYYIFYKVQGEQQHKKITFRANKNQVQELLKKISVEADKYDRKIEIEHV